MRIKKDYGNFKGSAKLKVKLRESESKKVVSEFESEIKIKLPVIINDTAAARDSQTSSTQNTLKTNLSESSESGSIIRLNSPKSYPKETAASVKTPVYKSKIERIKEYWIYGFAVVCVIVIFILLKER